MPSYTIGETWIASLNKSMYCKNYGILRKFILFARRGLIRRIFGLQRHPSLSKVSLGTATYNSRVNLWTVLQLIQHKGTNIREECVGHQLQWWEVSQFLHQLLAQQDLESKQCYIKIFANNVNCI